MRLTRLIPFLIMTLLLCACQSVPTSQMPKAAAVLVEKSARRLTLYDAQDQPIKIYRISLGNNPAGGKGLLGDGKTPEGHYFIDGRNPKSSYYLSLHISYPNADDLARAEQQGLRAGNAIFIHGQSEKNGWNFQKYSVGKDWTLGCISLTNGDMKQIYQLVDNGTPIEIRP